MTASPSADLTGAVLRPVRGHHAFEACVEQLATAIRLGVYPRETVLPPERELAERMSVSRATLREAIAALRAAGMVQTTRGRGGGTVVLHRPKAPRASAASALKGRHGDLLDSLAFRRVVEPGAAELAAQRDLDEKAEAMLRGCLAAVGKADSPALHRQCDSRLHLAIATACGSRLTIAAVTQVQRDLHDMLQAIPVLTVNIDHSNAQHEAILAAILSGDSRRARRVMSEHCEDTAALLRGLLG